MQRLAISSRTNNINSAVYNMRQSGATLQQIADKIGKAKERVRQILVQNYGSTSYIAALDKKAQKIKRTLGSTNTLVLRGSYIAWKEKG